MSTVREQATELLRVLGLDTSIVAMDVVDALAEAHLLRSEDTSEDTSTDVSTPVPTSRVWRSGDDEPGDDVRAVLTRHGAIATRASEVSWEAGWLVPSDRGIPQSWLRLAALSGPLVEVMLPEPVLS
jgi:hypothetical protein